MTLRKKYYRASVGYTMAWASLGLYFWTQQAYPKRPTLGAEKVASLSTRNMERIQPKPTVFMTCPIDLLWLLRHGRKLRKVATALTRFHNLSHCVGTIIRPIIKMFSWINELNYYAKVMFSGPLWTLQSGREIQNVLNLCLRIHSGRSINSSCRPLLQQAIGLKRCYNCNGSTSRRCLRFNSSRTTASSPSGLNAGFGSLHKVS